MTPYYMIHADLDGRSYVPEHYPDTANWDDVVADIVGGQIVGSVTRVSFVNLEGGEIIDMTRDIAMAVADHSRRTSTPVAECGQALMEQFRLQTYKDPDEDSLIMDTVRRLPNRRAA